MKKKFLAFLLSLTMLMGFAPGVTVLAADDLEGGSEAGQTDGGDLNGGLDDDLNDESDLDDEGDNNNICYVSIQLIDYDTGENITVADNPIDVQLIKTNERFYTGEAGDVCLEVTKGQEIRMPANFVKDYCLVGYTDEIEPLGAIQEEYNATFIFEGDEGVIYALFQKSTDVTVTFHWSSLDDVPLESDIEVEVPTGVSLETAILGTNAQIDSDTGEYLIYKEHGYKQCILAKAPLTSYESYDEIWSGSNTHWYGEVIRGNTDVYVCMLIPIEEVSLKTSLPYAGTAVSKAPVITTDADANYFVESAGWCDGDSEEITTETFEYGTDYIANVFLAADIGYCFVSDDALELTVVPGDKYTYWGAGETHVIVDITCKSEYVKEYECLDGDEKTIIEGSNAPYVARFDYAGEAAGTTGEHGLYARATSVKISNAAETISDVFERNNGSLIWDLSNINISSRSGIEALKTYTGKANTYVVGDVNEGSVIINVYPEYLNTLTPGAYTLTVYFDDGSSVSSSFTIAPKAVPATGETLSSTMIWGAVLVSIAALGAVVVLEKKRPGKKDVK